MLRPPPPEDHPRLSIGQAARSYDQDDLEWLDLCVKLRSSGMPLAAIRRYAELVVQGEGNEQQRLAILRHHQQHVTAQITTLTACQEVITFKVKLYEESLAAGTADPIWTSDTKT